MKVAEWKMWFFDLKPYPLIYEISTILMFCLPLIIGIHREGDVNKSLILSYKKYWTRNIKMAGKRMIIVTKNKWNRLCFNTSITWTIVVSSRGHTKILNHFESLFSRKGSTFLRRKMCWYLTYLVLLVSVVSCSSQVFPLWLLVSVFTLVGISFSMHGRH